MTGPRFNVIRSPGSLFVFDRERQASVQNGRHFQPAAARAEADRLNALREGISVTTGAAR